MFNGCLPKKKKERDIYAVAFISARAVIKNIRQEVCVCVCGTIVAVMIGLRHKCCYKHI